MECVICLEEVNNFKSTRECSCRFYVHQECLAKFKKTSKFACPICRRIKSEYNIYKFLGGVILIILLHIYSLLIGIILFKLLYG